MNYPWGTQRPFNDYASYILNSFGRRLQKISVNAGFTCPNRDGTKGTRGCDYCNNISFRPNYCEPEKTIAAQLEEGKKFFKGKYSDLKYLAYFQSFSNTYAPIQVLQTVYEEALNSSEVAGLVIGTRPDCMDDEVLGYLKKLSEKYFVTVEYGVESTIDNTLEKVNRKHTYQDSIDAIVKTHDHGLHVGVHLILGLPDETNEDFLVHAQRLSELPINSLKLHQLQIIKHTQLAANYRKDPSSYRMMTFEEYREIVIEFLELLNPSISIERFVSLSPVDLLVAPTWGLKNFEVTDKIEKEMRERGSWQGKKWLSGK